LLLSVIRQQASKDSSIRRPLQVGSEGVFDERRDFILLIGGNLIYPLEGALQADGHHKCLLRASERSPSV